MLAILLPSGRAYATTTYNHSIVAVSPAATAKQVVTPKRTFGTVVRTALTAQELGAGMELSFGLKLHNRAELEARVARGEILTPAQLEAYLPTPAEFAKVRTWLEAQGFSVSLEARTRHAVFVRGSVSRVKSKLSVTMARVATRDGEFTSAVTAPQLPDDIASLVEGIRGLQPHLIRHPAQRAPQQLKATDYNTITPAAVTSVYQAPSNLTGSGQTIAVIGDSSVTSSDATTFWQECGIAQSWSNISQISVGTGPGGDVTNQFEV
ncbi:MAG: protease pro-enzyme activation domain-containing protein, partial [Opitutales bacterium]